jgi:hypothetical protein
MGGDRRMATTTATTSSQGQTQTSDSESAHQNYPGSTSKSYATVLREGSNEAEEEPPNTTNNNTNVSDQNSNTYQGTSHEPETIDTARENYRDEAARKGTVEAVLESIRGLVNILGGLGVPKTQIEKITDTLGEATQQTKKDTTTQNTGRTDTTREATKEKENQTHPKRWETVPPKPTKALFNRKDREITIWIGTEHEGRERELLGKIQALQVEGAREAYTVKTIAPGKIVVGFGTVYAASKMREDDSWTREIIPGAKVKKQEYIILIHGIRGRKNMDFDAFREQLEIQNGGLHEGIKMGRIRWKIPRKAIIGRFTSLQMTMNSASEANRLMDEGILAEGVRRLCTIYHPEYEFKQCFKCGGFGHISKHCTATPKCEKCGEAHPSNRCEATNTPKCKNCGDQGHIAIDYRCPRGRAYKEKLHHKAERAPQRYLIPQQGGERQRGKENSREREASQSITSSPTISPAASTETSSGNESEGGIRTTQFTFRSEGSESENMEWTTSEGSVKRPVGRPRRFAARPLTQSLARSQSILTDWTTRKRRRGNSHGAREGTTTEDDSQTGTESNNTRSTQ